jgi:tRNA (guanine-N7-)-methyltransferase
LRKGQAALVEELLPRIAVPAEGAVDASSLFGDARPLWLEIGFGAGEHLTGQAAAHPDTGLIGCEPFLNGVVGALNHVRDQALDNVRLYMGDALDVLERLPDGGLSRAFLLHPDPWPKLRHARRRFVNPGPLDLLSAKLAPGSELRIGTDHPVYCRWTLMQMAARRDFKWLAAEPADWQSRPEDWPPTRYEAKARRLGHEVWYLRYRRI